MRPKHNGRIDYNNVKVDRDITKKCNLISGNREKEMNYFLK